MASHAATVQRKLLAHPATAQRQAQPHPATVQRQAQPHAAIVQRPLPPHPATVQTKPAAPLVPQSVQRMEWYDEDDDDFEVPDEYRPPPRPTLWDWVKGPLRQAEYNRLPIAHVTDLPPPVPQYAVLTPGADPQYGKLVRVPKVQTPAERRKAKGQQPSTSTPPVRAKKTKWKKVTLGAPDVGGYLNTLPTPGHHAFADIVIFVLNNNPPYNEIHIHRGPGGGVIQISIKQTGQQGNGSPVALGSALGQEAIARAADY